MRYFIESTERATAKTGNAYLKVQCTSEQKTKHSFFLWDNCDVFENLFGQGVQIMEMSVTDDPSFPKIVSFSQSAGDLSEFYSFIYESDEKATEVLEALIRTISDPLMRAIVLQVFNAPGPKPYSNVYQAFTVIPAAKAYHHDYRYGLLEHTHQVMTFINRICEAPMFADSLDRQLAITAGLLHDVGKVYEYDFNGVSCDYGHSFEVNQIYMGSHLYKGAEMVALAYDRIKHDEITAKEIPEEQWPLNDARIEHLKHCILAHHLQREWAAVPRQPQTLEAYLVFLADYFSAQFGKFTAIDWSQVSLDNLFGSTSKSDTFFGFNQIGE